MSDCHSEKSGRRSLGVALICWSIMPPVLYPAVTKATALTRICAA
jgi:hypothetical protein